MTEQNYPITPPPKLVKQWLQEADVNQLLYPQVAAKAAQWGADQELEACCEWLKAKHWLGVEPEFADELRSARRPKPPSLKEQALQALSHLLDGAAHSMDTTEPADYIRRALEQIND